MRVYIIEDSKIVRDRLVSLLEEMEGLEIVGQAGSVKAATENIFRQKPDVMLIDIMLPDGNGLDVLAKVQACRLNIVPIVMTLYPCSDHQELAINHGAAYFFDKAKELWKIPVALEQLIAEQRAA